MSQDAQGGVPNQTNVVDIFHNENRSVRGIIRAHTNLEIREIY